MKIAWGHWFVLFNTLLAFLIASRYAFYADWPETLLGKLYFFVSLFGHFSFVVFAFYLLLLFPLSFIVRNERTFRGISVVLATLCLSLLLVDTEVFRRFFLHLSPLVWDLLIHPESGELTKQWQLFFVPMPLILLIEMLYSRQSWQKLRRLERIRWSKYVGLFLTLCFLATHLIYAWADMAMYRPITTQKANYPLSYPMTARSFLEKHGLLNRLAYEEKVAQHGRIDGFYLNYPQSDLQVSQPSGANIIVVNLSGLSQAQFTPQAMPTLTQISQQSHRFAKHFSAGDSAQAGVLNLFYGLSGRYVDAVLAENTPSPLISLLHAQGYQFGLFSHNGFKLPIYRNALFKNERLLGAKSNYEALSQWKKWLESADVSKPLFNYLELNIQSDPKSNQADLGKLDAQIASFWASLNEKGLLSESVVIFTADSAAGGAQPNPFSVQRTQVPLVMYWQAKGSQYRSISSHLDLLPTLLSQYVGVTTPVSHYSQGVDLTRLQQRKWVLTGNSDWIGAILPDGTQYQINSKGKWLQFDANNQKQAHANPPLALLLQLIKLSNRFIDK